MNIAAPKPGPLVQVLSVLSVTFFWLMPLSPVLAIGAVIMTKETAGWSRNLAVTGAVLCIAYTIGMACLVATLALQIV